ncbi:MAG TPA: hypothetical protein VK658_09835 [Chryseolinea sp.]|nr:hypothetical protein [Chryseolinea sp.]
MKTIIFFLSISASFAGYAQNAQQQGDSTTQAPYENKDDILYRKLDNMVAVPAAEVPQQLRSAWDQQRYRGWAQGKIFRSADGKTYELQLEKNNKTKIYRFDAQGKVVKE